MIDKKQGLTVSGMVLKLVWFRIICIYAYLTFVVFSVKKTYMITRRQMAPRVDYTLLRSGGVGHFSSSYVLC